jgi:hypothetical protein
MRSFALAAGVAILAGPAVAGGVPLNPSVTYVCERGVVLPVVFIRSATPSLAVALIEGQLVTLRQVPTGSGMFYADTDEERGYRLRGQGDALQLRWLAADHTAEEQVLLAECSAG